MPVRPIAMNGDPVLHHPTTPIGEVTDEIRTLVADMFDTMAAATGVGLAANQVGVPLRVFVYDCPDDTGVRRSGHVLNPVLETSEKPEGMPDPEEDWEGCLSVPGESFPTGRAEWAKVTGTDLEGELVSIEGKGYFARCLQHETDHLDGVIYLDRLVGRYKRESRRAINAREWTKHGTVSWDPSKLQAEEV